jgi:hypothetical protein
MTEFFEMVGVWAWTFVIQHKVKKNGVSKLNRSVKFIANFDGNDSFSKTVVMLFQLLIVNIGFYKMSQ